MPKSTLIDLPNEILGDICIFLARHDHQTSILNLIRTCRVLRNVATRFLYYDIDTSDWYDERMDLLLHTLWPPGPCRSFVRRLHFKPRLDRRAFQYQTPFFYMDGFLRITQNLQVLHLNMKDCWPFSRAKHRFKMEALRHIILENLHGNHGCILDFITEAPKLEVLTMRNYWYKVKSGLFANLKCLELINLDSIWPGSAMLDEFLLQCPQLESFTLTTERDSSVYYCDPVKVADISVVLSPYRNTLRHLKILWKCWYCQAIGSLRDFTCLETVVIGFHDRRSWLPETPLVDFLPPTVQSVTLDMSTFFMVNPYDNLLMEIDPIPNVFASMRNVGEAKQQGLLPSLQSVTHSSSLTSHHYNTAELEEMSGKYGVQFRRKSESAFADTRYS